MEETHLSKDLPFTLIIRRLVKPLHIKEYEQWLIGASREVKSFQGNIGVHVIRPMHIHHPEYVLIIQFNSKENLEKFQESETRKQWLKNLEKISIGQAFQKNYSAFDSLFISKELKKTSDFQDLPPKYKTFIITLLSAYPLILLISYISKFLPENIPYPIKLFASLIITLVITVYLTIPLLGKLLKNWLTP